MPREDYNTSTVSGAAAHAAKFCEPHEFEPEGWDEDYDEDEDEEEDEDYWEDPCGCSDPGCPCDGSKRGGPI